MSGTRFLLLTVVILVIQLFVAEFINVHHMLYIAVILLPVMILPYRYNRSVAMLIALAIGLLTDLSYDGVLGLNAAALVAAAFFRDPLLSLVASKSARENLSAIGPHTLGRGKFTLFTLLLYSLFFIFYIALDNVLYFSFFYTFGRLVLNVFANTVVMVIMESTLLRGPFGGR